MLFGGALVSASFLAPDQQLDLWLVALAGTGGNVVGSWLAYWAGYAGGRPADRSVGPVPADPPARGRPGARLVRAPRGARRVRRPPASGGPDVHQPAGRRRPHAVRQVHRVHGARMPALVPAPHLARLSPRRALGDRRARSSGRSPGRSRSAIFVAGVWFVWHRIRSIRREEEEQRARAAEAEIVAEQARDAEETVWASSSEAVGPSSRARRASPRTRRPRQTFWKPVRSYIIRERLWAATESESDWKPSWRAWTISARSRVSPIPLRRCSGTTAMPSSGVFSSTNPQPGSVLGEQAVPGRPDRLAVELGDDPRVARSPPLAVVALEHRVGERRDRALARPVRVPRGGLVEHRLEEPDVVGTGRPDVQRPSPFALRGAEP